QLTNLFIGLQSAAGQVLQGTQELFKVRFTARTGQASAFVPLTFRTADAIKPGNLAYSNYVLRPSILAVIQAQPLLLAGFGTNRSQNLTLLGRLNESYQLQFSTNPFGPWTPLLNYVQTNNPISIRMDGTNAMRFYRLFQP